MSKKRRYKQYGIVNNDECWVIFNRENGDFLYIDYNKAQDFLCDFLELLQRKKGEYPSE